MQSVSNNGLNFGAKPISKKIINQTKAQLLDKNIKEVDIYCHASPDEDTVNSAKVLSNWLTANNKKVNICVTDEYIDKLYFDTKKYNIKKSSNNADMSLVVDFNSSNRMPETYKELYSNNSKKVLGFDHHLPEKDALLSKKIYIDDSARSCCSVIARFFEGMNQKLNKEDLKNLYCGMVSDYKKSKLLSIIKKDNKYSVIQSENLIKNKNAKEVFDNIDKNLNDKEKQKILKHLDVLSNLNSDEKAFQKQVFKNMQVSPNGKLAYSVVEPNDKLWQKLGMDNPTTSEILKDFRQSVLEKDSSKFSSKQKSMLKDVDTAIVFYRKSDNENIYKLSIHSKSNSALDLIKKVQENYNPNLIAGGHEDRAGGKIMSIDTQNTHKLVSDFVNASKIL